MKINQSGIDLIKRSEGCKLSAYLCPAGIPTIGYGNTYYENGNRVKIGDKITDSKANELLLMTLDKFSAGVIKLVKQPLNDNQFSAIVSLAYNIGLGNFQKSSVLKKLNINPTDTTIADSFKLWNKGGGKVLPGLVKRRVAEATLYFA